MTLFLCLSDRETFEIMSVLRQDITSRDPVTVPHKIMVWFADAANRHLKSNTPKGAYCIRVRRAAECSEKSREFVEILWDRGCVTIEVVRDNDTCAYFSLPRENVTQRNVDEVIVTPVGEDAGAK